MLLPTVPYFVAPWSERHLQGDLFDRVPLALPTPPDAIFLEEEDQNYVSGPFEVVTAMVLTPSFVTAADVGGATDMRTLVPVRTVAWLQAQGALAEDDIALLRADRLRGYFFLPEGGHIEAESAALLTMPLTMHRDVIEGFRSAQLSAQAHRHLRIKLMAYYGGYLVDHDHLGQPGRDKARLE